ncbi:hypothetical protein BPAE_0072g00020 [Botrytis paeoniae]|uniref:Uncharacterized protein n=1 Tax=Botrytis paeoniae TaxID=278948 RepID=A0A4Z1FU75_9HELO|nr:hypothetical protein BPAE_0072g00020 [Botrytis paeoniae]
MSGKAPVDIAKPEETLVIQNYKSHCNNVEATKALPEVVDYRNAAATYKATKDNKDVDKFIKLRGPDASASKLKKLKEIEVVAKFAEAEKRMNKLADRTNVTKYLRAKEAKKRMEENNLEVMQYNMANQSLKKNKETDKVQKSLPQHSGSSTRSTQNQSNAGDGNGTQTRPRRRKAPEELNYPQGDWRGLRAPQNFFGDQLPPAVDNPNNTPRDGSRGRPRDRSDPQTGSKPSASAPKNVEPKINSGKHRRASPHTDKERDIGNKGVDVVRSKVEADKWKLP